LYADESLHLKHTDPDRREAMVGFGAALNHCVIALAALGWQATIHRLPDPGNPDHRRSVSVWCHFFNRCE